jgi:hypothetical protein
MRFSMGSVGSLNGYLGCWAMAGVRAMAKRQIWATIFLMVMEGKGCFLGIVHGATVNCKRSKGIISAWGLWLVGR